MSYQLRQFDLTILVAIAERPTYGYELMSRFEKPPSVIYHALRKLHSLELTQTKREIQKKAPPITRYYISRKGKHVLSQTIETRISTAHHQSEKFLALYRQERQLLVMLFGLKHHY